MTASEFITSSYQMSKRGCREHSAYLRQQFREQFDTEPLFSELAYLKAAVYYKLYADEVGVKNMNAPQRRRYMAFATGNIRLLTVEERFHYGLASLALGQTDELNEQRSNTMANKKKPEGAISFPNILGCSITSAIRWMGNAGYTAFQVRGLVQKLGLTVADNTINCQLTSGRRGDDGPHGKMAAFTAKEQAELKRMLAEFPPKPVKVGTVPLRVKATAQSTPTKDEGKKVAKVAKASTPAKTEKPSVKVAKVVAKVTKTATPAKKQPVRRVSK